MSFSKRQFLGFGLILAMLFILFAIIIVMLGSLKGNFDEITGDRYGKVDIITDIRSNIYQIDSQMGLAMADTGRERAHLDAVQKGKQEVVEEIATLKQIVNTSRGKGILSVLESRTNDYFAALQSFSASLTDGDGSRARELYLSQDQMVTAPIAETIDEFEAFQKNLVDQRMTAYENRHKLTVGLILGSGVLFLLLGILIALWVIRSTTRRLREVKDTLYRVDVASASALPSLDVAVQDEIGDISAAFNQMIVHLEKYRTNERLYNARMERQNRLQTRLAEVSDLYLRLSDTAALAERLIRKVTPMLEAAFGAFYLARGHQLHKLAAYADQGNPAGEDVVAFGQGLTGQAAVEQRILRLTEVPDSYIRVSSALGSAPARSILVAPVVYQGRTLAVLEFASLGEFGEQEEELVARILETLGITIDNVEGRMEVERLLVESQTLTEELQSQSEELQTQAVELQSQSEELQSQSEELRISNEQLEEQNGLILDRARELDQIRKELESRNGELELSSRYKSEFLANMSHELRTPLNSILILSQMLMENRQGHLNPDEEEYSRTIYQSGRDLLALINDILDLSKVEAGKIQLDIGEVSLRDLPSSLKWSFLPQAEKKGLTFSVEVAPGLPEVLRTDEQRLQQILKNLLSNAVKFTEEGSVGLSIYRPDEAELNRTLPCGKQSDEGLRLTADPFGDGSGEAASCCELIAFAVRDTGIGVPPDKQALIFDAFQQADGATSRKYGGTGLGLSISREFAGLLGGFIAMESEEGKGSTFILYLPVSYNEGMAQRIAALGGVEAAAEKMAAAAAESLTASASGRVLNESAEPLPDLTEASKPATAIAEHLLQDSASPLPENERFRGKRVLIVDDDVRNVFALTVALENQGMVVHSAMNGREAVDELMNSAAYDLVLMDIMMPEMDGYETMRTIRGELGLDKLPVIALTAKAMKNDREKCLEAGASDYISKPLNLEQLFSLMRVWLTS